jgi:hypothetical protein
MLALTQARSAIFASAPGMLQDHAGQFDDKTKKLVKDLRDHFDAVEEIIAGGKEFVRTQPFSDDSINKVVKNTFEMISWLDQIKLGIF